MPGWAVVRAATSSSKFQNLGFGEREALSLAIELEAEFLLIDDAAARATAVSNGIHVKGTLAILQDAADAGLVEIQTAIAKLRSTSMYLSDDLVKKVLEQHNKG